jgi:hypothetical protein
MIMNEREKEEVVDLIFTNYPDFVFEEQTYKDITILNWKVLPKLNQEFHIEIDMYNLGEIDIEVNIIARLNNQEEGTYFWYYPFNPYNAKTIAEATKDTCDFLLEELKVVSAYKLRVIQKIRWFSQSFTCEYQKDEIWHRYYGHSGLRTANMKFPKIDGKEKTYY